MTKEPLVTHRGGCHCGAVRWEFEASPDLLATDCNCSVCTMKRNDHCIVPEGRFRLLQGEDMLTLYQFNTKQAKHVFCRVCGVQSFYTPRSNPDGRAITVACIDAGTVRSVTTEKHDGVNWEESFKHSNVAARSKE